MNGKLNDILLRAPREKDGARTLSRYGFQIHTSLSKILKLHNEGKEFRALFDHFDDLVIIEDIHGEHTVRSYQIKGKASGAWTATALSKCKTKGDAVTSIIGKMYQLTEVFETHITSAHFLTNAHYSLKMVNDKKSTVDDELIKCSQLHEDEKNKLSETLCCSFPNPRDPSEDDLIIFEKTDVPLKNYSVSIKGELVEALSIDTPSNVTGIYNALVAEILTKAKETTSPTSINGLFDLKSISSDQLTEALNQADGWTSILDCWDEVSADFAANNFSGNDRIRLKISVIEYLRKRSNGASSIRSLTETIDGALQSESSMGNENDNLFLNSANLKNKIMYDFNPSYDEMLIHAASLVAIFEKLK